MREGCSYFIESTGEGFTSFWEGQSPPDRFCDLYAEEFQKQASN